MVVLPVYLGFLIATWWDSAPKQIALAVAVPVLGSLLRLLVTSLHDGSDWFGRIFRAVGAVGFVDPYVRQILLTLFFPVLVTILASVMFSIFQRRGHA
jgi:hypothetical protein